MKKKHRIFVALSHYNNRRMPDVKLVIDKKTIQSSKSVRNFGVIFEQICPCQIRLLRCHKVLLTIFAIYHMLGAFMIMKHVTLSSVHFNILSRLDYGNVLLMGANSIDITRLHRLQNWGAKIIFLANKKDHASPLLQQLH